MIFARDHPGRGVGGMVGLLQVVGGIQIDVRCVGIHLLAIGVGRGAMRGQAIVLVMLEQDLLF